MIGECKETAADEAAILDYINRFYNENITWMDDEVLYGVKDYWATPKELWDKGAGDCEDIAIAKYFAIKEWIGIKDLYLLYCQDTKTNTRHVVLYVRGKIFDNTEYYLCSIKDRKDLIPLYYFNEDGIYDTNFVKIGNIDRLHPWEKLLKRKEQQDHAHG